MREKENQDQNRDIELSSLQNNMHDDNYGDGYYTRISLKESSDSSKSAKLKHKKHKRHIFAVVLAVALCLILVVGVYFSLVLFRIKADGEALQHNTSQALAYSNSVKNIMVFGADKHEAGDYGRSDTMLLISVDTKNRKLKMTSFLRDVYLEIPEYGSDRLNAAYAYGGPALAIQTIEHNYALRIDSYIVIDFDSFTSIIDAMGGVDIELTDEEIDYINWQSWRNKQVETRNELTDTAGIVHLNGRQALWYARNRDSAGSDFDRTSRQRKLMDIVLSKLQNSDPFTLMSVLYEVSPYLTTNISRTELANMGFQMLSYIRYERQEKSIPNLSEGNFSDTWVGSALVLTIDDMEYERKKLYDFIFEGEYNLT